MIQNPDTRYREPDSGFNMHPAFLNFCIHHSLFKNTTLLLHSQGPVDNSLKKPENVIFAECLYRLFWCLITSAACIMSDHCSGQPMHSGSDAFTSAE
jgi:hypothetical protein